MPEANTQNQPTYLIHQLLPSNGIQAVFSELNTAGESNLAARPLDFVGLATETHSEIESLQVMVGIVVLGGAMEIVNPLNGYCGLMMPGQNMEDCVCARDPDASSDR